MFRTHLLDEHLQDALRDVYHGLRRRRDIVRRFYKQGRRDTPWLAFLKRYLTYRILSKPHLSPECPETLLRRAAARLGELLGEGGEGGEDGVRRHMAAICQVAFWEPFCYRRFGLKGQSPDTYITSPFNPAYHGQGDEPLKEILLQAAIHSGDVGLAKNVYALESWDLRDVEVAKKIYALQSIDTAGVAGAISRRQDGRLACAASHGGREILLLFGAREWNVKLESCLGGELSDDELMEYILNALAYGGDADLIHYLLDAGEWGLSGTHGWNSGPLRGAMLRASSPDVLERLARLAGPGFSLLNSTNHFRDDGSAWAWATPMSGRLKYHAAAGNTAMVRYLLDHHGAGALLNNPDRASLPAHPTTQEAADDVARDDWLKPRSRLRGKSRRHQAGNRPLLQAAGAGAADTVELLLDRGADPNAHPVGATPLGEAARRGNATVARLLLGRGRADPNLGTPPPVALAVAAEDGAMLALLLESGAVVDTPETGGWAAALARRAGLESMLDVLEELGVERGAAWHHVPSLEEFILGERYFGNPG
ncbi:hypothetical protein RB595_006667 [Gaeumannomyces hyphopodioides]